MIHHYRQETELVANRLMDGPLSNNRLEAVLTKQR